VRSCCVARSSLLLDLLPSLELILSIAFPYPSFMPRDVTVRLCEGIALTTVRYHHICLAKNSEGQCAGDAFGAGIGNVRARPPAHGDGKGPGKQFTVDVQFGTTSQRTPNREDCLDLQGCRRRLCRCVVVQ
jgi:hypothetical protein